MSERPYSYESRLHEIFREVEDEFAKLYEENQELRRRLIEHKISVPVQSISPPVLSSSLVSGSLASSSSSSSSTTTSTDKSRFEVKEKSKQITAKIKAGRSKLVAALKNPTDTPNFIVRSAFLGHHDGVWDVTFSPWDRRLLATASADRTARVWFMDPSIISANGDSAPQCHPCIVKYVGHRGSVNCVRFHEHSRLVISASGDKSIHIWRVPDSVEFESSRRSHMVGVKESKPRPALSAQLTRSSSSSSPKSLLESLSQSQHVISNMMEVSSSTLSLLSHTNVVSAAEWISGGESVASCSWDKTVRIWNAETGKEEVVLKGHEAAVTDLRGLYSEVVSASADHTIAIWDSRQGFASSSIVASPSDTVRSVAFADSGSSIVSAGDDRNIRVWDRRNTKIPTQTIHCSSSINRIDVRMHTRSGRELIGAPLDSGQTRIYDLAGNRIGSLKDSLSSSSSCSNVDTKDESMSSSGSASQSGSSGRGHEKMVCSCSWSPDCEFLVTSAFDRKVFGWYAQT